MLAMEEPFTSTAQDEGDRKLFVQFFAQAVQNEDKSVVEGRPIFDEQDCVRIITPGSRDVMVTLATPDYQRRFPRQWAQYKQSQEQTLEGTPLDQVPFLSVAQIAELKAVQCHTLEQLAGLSDTALNRMMGLSRLRDRAQVYLAASKDAAPLVQMQAELEARDGKIALLESQIAELQKLLTPKTADKVKS